jgi:hypothetical protein
LTDFHNLVKNRFLRVWENASPLLHDYQIGISIEKLYLSSKINLSTTFFYLFPKNLTVTFIQILAMVEEAAGIRMYESKKEGCLRMIEKKENKVQEITRVLFSL